MNLSWTLIGGAAALALGCLVMLPVWFFTRRLPDEEWQYAPEGPEIRKPRLSRRTKVRLLVALPVLFTGAVWIFAGVMADAIQKGAPPPAYGAGEVDFGSDQWAAECGGSRAVYSRRFRSRSTLKLHYGSFTGAKTLWRLYNGEGRSQEITLQYQVEVEEGQADLVLVHPDKTVTRLSEQSSPYTFTAGEGETRLRLIGDKGKLAVELTVPRMSGQWME